MTPAWYRVAGILVMGFGLCTPGSLMVPGFQYCLLVSMTSPKGVIGHNDSQKSPPVEVAGYCNRGHSIISRVRVGETSIPPRMKARSELRDAHKFRVRSGQMLHIANIRT